MKSAKKLKGLLSLNGNIGSAFTCSENGLPAEGSNCENMDSLTLSNSKWESRGLRGEFDCFTLATSLRSETREDESSEAEGNPQLVVAEDPDPELIRSTRKG